MAQENVDGPAGPIADHGGAIAVIGMSGRFPGAGSPDALWDLLLEGREAVSRAPADRPWMRELHDRTPRTPGRIPTDRGGFLPGIDRFDSRFFDMPPREAARTDPQLRILLETTHEALEDAFVPRERLASAATGVFVGAISGDYWLRQIPDLDGLDIYSELGSASRAAYSGRISYAFGLTGPSLTVDTACSSSLMAVHLACQSLRAGECRTALAGGVNLILTPHMHLTFGWAGALSPTGSCKFADTAADGFVRSEGAGMVLLKPLHAALADGDRVRAVITGSAAGNNGFTGNGMAASHQSAQAATMRSALQAAGADGADIDFVEAHGTGTPLGDRVELTALGEVLVRRAEDREPCLVGSVKTNIGHTEAAAGIAGLIKTVLSLERRHVPGNPHLLAPNPAVTAAGSALTVPATGRDLAPGDRPLLAGLNSFGATGTNVHAVLASAPPRPAAFPPGGRPLLLPVSARSPQALAHLTDAHLTLLEETTASRSADAAARCVTAARGRTHWEHRRAFVAASPSGLAEELRRAAGQPGGSEPREKPRIVFVFPGQGSHWTGMCRELLTEQPVFAATLERCADIVATHTGWSLTEALHDDDTTWQQRTALVQPALWAVSTALCDLWASWGIRPDAVLGQSQGEIPAAYCAGALDLADAGRLSCLRAALIDKLAPPGAMARIAAGPDRVRRLLAELGVRASVAVEESAAATVVAGSPRQIERLVRACADRALTCRTVQVAYAAHSAQIDPVRRPLLKALTGLAPRRARIPFLSTVTGGEVGGSDLDAEYWWRNLRETVRLEPAVRAASGPRPTVFLQISPHPILTPALAATTPESDTVLGTLWRGEPELLSLYRALAALYEAGADIDWDGVHGTGHHPVDLPRYPWQRERHWHQAPSYRWPEIGARPGAAPAPSGARPPAAVSDDPAALTQESTESLLDAALDLAGTDAYLLGHRVADRPVLPGAVSLELCLRAAGPGREPADVRFEEMLPLDGPTGTRLRVATAGGGTHRVAVEGRTVSATAWTRHASATLVPAARTVPARRTEQLRTVRATVAELTGAEFYERLSRHGGNAWQGAFSSVRRAWAAPDECLAELDVLLPPQGHLLHPAFLDACMQPAVLLASPAPGRRGLVLTGLDRVHPLRMPPAGRAWSHARVTARDGDAFTADVTVTDDQNEVIMELTGLRAAWLTPHPHPPAPEPARGTTPTAAAAAAEDSPGPRPPAPPRPAPPSRSPAYDSWRQTTAWEPVHLAEPTTGTGSWLVLGALDATGRALTRELTRHGHTVTPAAGLPQDPDEIRALLTEAAEDAPLHAIIVLATAPATEDAPDDTAPDALQETAVRSCAAFSTLVRVLADDPPGHLPRVYLATSGARPDAPAGTGSDPLPWGATLWGLGPVAARENPELRLTLVDLADSNAPGTRARLLAQVVRSDPPEPRLALRDGRATALRLRPGTTADHDGQPTAAPALRRLHTTGGIHGLALHDAPRVPPGPGEVEIEVSHAGLNYHDVLAVTGTDGNAPAGPPRLGCECAGTITALGPGVTGLTVGDQVLAFAHPALSSHVLAPAELVQPRPAALSPAEAAALPAAHATAYHALVDRARLAPGERVLIHSATGGVGLAALDIARMCGATVYATAGTPAKRALLEQLGVARVADSRSTDFAREFRDPGGNGGVDVVLGSGIGPVVEAGFSLLNPDGRYVDLAINVAEGRLAPPTVRVLPAEDAGEAFSLLARSGHTGKVVLDFPRPASPAADPAPPGPNLRPDASYLVTGGLGGLGGLVARWLADRGARHLILTGRTHLASLPDDAPALGLLRELDATGARVEYAVLDAADASGLTSLLERRAAAGLPPVAGVVHTAAVLEPGPVAHLTPDLLDRTLRPKVAGTWALHRAFSDHALDFFTLFSSAASTFSGLTLSRHLGAYAAANAFTDSLAAHRRSRGLPATVINWGYWTQVGLAARLSDQSGHDVRPRGMGPIAPDDAPGLFDAWLTTPGNHLVQPPPDWPSYFAAYPHDAADPLLGPHPAAHPTPPRGTADPEPVRLPKSRPEPWTPPRTAADTTSGPVPGAAHPAAFEPAGHDARPGEEHGLPAPASAPPSAAAAGEAAPPQGPREDEPAPATTDTAKAALAAARTAARPGPAAVTEFMVTQLARVLGLPAEQVDTTRPMNRLGLDSIMAVELRGALRRTLDVDIPVPLLLGSESLRSVAARIATDAGTTTGPHA
ncbi:SDR family NAD(P)-dependent oxidoreductase [Streptomyces sp. NPDC004126]|uniref:SDR family NAD(P)-dependent oxidoreductase n=1 Tax=Streptomyces sp. NPDC004126 TaxID=3390695 RepID=UPI003D01836E